MLELYSGPIALVLVASLIAAVTDVWKFKVYNLLTLPMVAGGLFYNAIEGGTPGLVGSIVGALAAFGLTITLYAMGGLGAGDVKFVTALGAWLCLPLTFYVIIAGCIAAGVYAAVLLVIADSPGETLVKVHLLWLRLACLGRDGAHDDRVEAELKRHDRRRRLIPFSAMIAIGLVATVGWLRVHSPTTFAAAQRPLPAPASAVTAGVGDPTFLAPLARGKP